MRLRRKRRDPEGRMPLVDHLRELRNRTVIALIAIAVLAIVGWLRYNEIFALLTAPVQEVAAQKAGGTSAQVVFSSLTDSFSIQMAVSLFVGVILASPVWVYQLWAFIVPGLTRKEKRGAILVLVTAVPLFIAGCLLAYLVLPKAVSTLLSFTPTAGSNILPAADYLSFVLKFILAFGLAFLLPVFLVGMNAVGVLPARIMVRGWRVATFLCFLFTAIMTPTPDPWMMIIMALPMIALFFLACGIASLNDRRRAKRAAHTDLMTDALADDRAAPL